MFQAYRWHVTVALALVLLFASPIAIDYLVDRPNNIHQIRLYLRQHHGEHNSLSQSLLYLVSFLTYDAHPELALAQNPPDVKAILTVALPVRCYWLCISVLLAVVIVLCMRVSRRTSLFVRLALAEIGVVVLLFLYWSWRITGPMFMFNGFFFFSVQLFGLFLMCAAIAEQAKLTFNRSLELGLACLATLPVPFAIALKGNLPNDTEIPSIFDHIARPGLKSVEITMSASEKIWPIGAGLARYLLRFGENFCIGREWAFMFGEAHVCRAQQQDYHVCLVETLPTCKKPCKILYHRAGLFVVGSPKPALLQLPALVSAADCTHDSEGFNLLEGSSEWSEKKSSLSFELATDSDQTKDLDVAITGTLFPGRPAEVFLNSKPLGWISNPGPGTAQLKIGPGQILWGAANTIEFVVPDAGPVGGDMRTLGYFFHNLVISQP